MGFEPTYNCMNRVRVGRIGDGGKWVCDPQVLGRLWRPCIVYTFGSNGEISFEEDLLSITSHRCEIHIFDPTIFWPNNHYFNGDSASDLKDENVRNSLRNVHFHPLGLGTAKEEIREFGPVDALPNIMKNLGHTHLDILKIDIEGKEFDTFFDSIFLQDDLPYDQILVKLHAGGVPASRIINFFETLEKFGYKIFMKEPVMYRSCALERICYQIQYAWVRA